MSHIADELAEALIEARKALAEMGICYYDDATDNAGGLLEKIDKVLIKYEYQREGRL